MSDAGPGAFERALRALLIGSVATSARHPRAVLVVALLVSLAAGALVRTNLGVMSETDDLFDENLPFRKNRDALYEIFPRLEDRVLVVIDAPSEGRARDAAAGHNTFPRSQYWRTRSADLRLRDKISRGRRVPAGHRVGAASKHMVSTL